MSAIEEPKEPFRLVGKPLLFLAEKSDRDIYDAFRQFVRDQGATLREAARLMLFQYTSGTEILVIGPDPLKITMHRSLQEALYHMNAAPISWLRSEDGGNRTFTGSNGEFARIVNARMTPAIQGSGR